MRARKVAKRLGVERLELRQLLAGDLEVMPLLPGPHAQPEVYGERAPLTSLPQLRSNPAAAAKLFLDFDGHFEASWSFRQNVTTPAFDQDGNPNDFAASELAAIDEIWRRVSEDYAPFNIDVTTIDPGHQTDRVVGVVAIGGSYSDWYGSAAGGVAFVGGFSNFSPNVGYVFSSSLGNGIKNVAEGASHEAGHLFGLSHQARWSGTTLSETYHSGGGDWAPIMGNSYGPSRSTWHNGTTSASATTLQDDLAVIASATNGFGYKADDYADTLAAATQLAATTGGLLHANSDVDVFKFSTAGGTSSFNLTLPVGANLDTKLRLLNSSGGVVQTSDPAGSYTAAISAALPAGTYFVEVGAVPIYGNVGQYTLNSSIAAPANTNVTLWLDGEPVTAGATIDFGVAAANDVVVRYLTLTNEGQLPTNISSVTLPAGYSLVEPFQPVTLGANESLNLEIRLETTTAGTKSGTLAIGGDVTATFALTGRVLAAASPTLRVDGQPIATGATYDFGVLALNAAVEKAFTLTNTGESDLSLFDVATTGSYLADGDTFGVLAAGESFTILVAPDTSSEGSIPGTLVITTDVGTLTINLAASVQGANIAVLAGAQSLADGGTFDFGQRALNSSVTQTFTIRNDGFEQLTLGKLTVPTSVSLVKNITKAVLLPGEATSFTVKLKTTVAGAVTGTITIPSSDSDTPAFRVNLTGQIVGPVLTVLQAGTPIASDTLFSFGTVSRGSTATTTFTLRNTGLAPLTLKSISVPRGFKITTSPATTKLAAGQSLTLTVRLETRRVATYSGNLVIRPLNLPQFTIRLSGQVTAPAQGWRPR